jgi:membrane-associated phospholipid phosphatase
MSIIQTLEKLDKVLFVFINHDSDFPVLDPVMLFLRNPLTWIPFYIFMAWWSFVKLRKNAWLFIFCSLVTVALTDSVTAFLLKPFFERLRPCYEPGLTGMVRILDDCGGKFSFPSNHAANHFGLATFWICSVWKLTGRKWYWLWFWAFMICYAQVYVGKHYPGDILGGAIFGGFVAGFTYAVFNWFLRRTQKNPELHLQRESYLDPGMS